MPRVPILLLLALPVLAFPAVAPAQSPPPRDPAAAAGCADPRMAFGCANAANIEAMAAPEDLAAGRTLSPARGSQEAAAVARLDADKVKDLKREGTESAGGSPQ